MANNNESTSFQFEVTNNDTGSIKAPSISLEVGDVLFLEGEEKGRTITYLMGAGDRQHACAKGSGPFPIGLVRFNVLKKDS